MTLLGRRLMAALSLALTLLAGGIGLVGEAARAQGLFDTPKYAAIVVDARTGEVLYSRRADDQRYPASISKVMTLYLTFEALATGRLSLNDTIVVSPHAASQGPSKLGLRAGQTITVDNAIRAAAVLSANDMAVALAERVGGSEDRFAQRMTVRARELGMMHSRFVNANGLPRGGDGNISTARDIAILSRSVMRDYPQYYGYFGQHEFDYGRRVILNHNRLLLTMPGVDGLKTGYTNAAGYNLAASAVRDGRRLITVVLGGSSTAARNDNVETLLTSGFDVLSRRARGQNITIAQNISEPDDAAGPIARPSIEQGSGDQRQLSVEMAELATPSYAHPTYARPTPTGVAAAAPVAAPTPAPMLAVAKPIAVSPAPAPILTAQATAPRPAPARPAKPTLIAAVGSSVVLPEGCSSDGKAKGRRHGRRAACAVQVAAAGPPDCAKLHGRRRRVCEKAETAAPALVAKAELKALASDCLRLRGSRRRACEKSAPATVAPVLVAKAEAPSCGKLHGRRRQACEKVEAAAPVQTAKAEAPDCGKLHGRRRRTCDKQDVQVASAEAKEAAGGRYVIQVGAYNSLRQAQDHLSSVMQRYAGAVASAAGKVTSGGRGAYRVRFSGMSQAGAKSACRTLAHKGERCMVMAAG